jgi:hypothetical protein
MMVFSACCCPFSEIDSVNRRVGLAIVSAAVALEKFSIIFCEQVTRISWGG